MSNSYAPKFDELLDVAYCLVNTHFVYRALSCEDCCKIMSHTIYEYDDALCTNMECNANHSYRKVSADLYDKNEKNIYIIEPGDHIKLLYATNGNINLCNNSAEDEVAKTNDALIADGIETRGSFVFKLMTNKKVKFNDILSNFVVQLTHMDGCFCVTFDITTLEECNYYPNSKALEFKFDTAGTELDHRKRRALNPIDINMVDMMYPKYYK
jgi:hypothetical protein